MNFFEKILVSLGLAEENSDEEYDEGEVGDDFQTGEDSGKINSKKNRIKNKKSVVAFPSKSKDKCIILTTPGEYEEAQRIGEYLKNSQPVIVSLEKLPPEDGKQLVDFISGTVFGLDGTVHKIGKQIFLFSPPEIEIMGDMTKQLNEEDWNEV